MKIIRRRSSEVDKQLLKKGEYWSREKNQKSYTGQMSGDGLIIMLSFIVDHTFVWEGIGEEGEIWRGSPQWQSHNKQQHVRPRSGTRKGPERRTMSTTEPILKQEIKNQKLLEIEKEIVREVVQSDNTTWENLQIAKHKSVQESEWHWFARCDLQIFSGYVVTLNNFTRNLLFYFQWFLVLICFHLRQSN